MVGEHHTDLWKDNTNRMGAYYTQKFALPKLEYHPYSLQYLVDCKVFLSDPDDVVVLSTSQDAYRPMAVYGTLRFVLGDAFHELKAFRMGNSLFIPFTDTHEKSYGGGRYLDIDIVEDKPLFLDFNFAYTPYCAYSSHYDCPLVPKENRLPVEIPAGMMYEPVK